MRRSHAPVAPMPRLSGHAPGVLCGGSSRRAVGPPCIADDQLSKAWRQSVSRLFGDRVRGFHAVYGDCRGDDRGACLPSSGADDATAFEDVAQIVCVDQDMAIELLT